MTQNIKMKYEYVVGIEFSQNLIEAFLNEKGKLGFRLVQAYLDPASSEADFDEVSASILIMERLVSEGEAEDSQVT